MNKILEIIQNFFKTNSFKLMILAGSLLILTGSDLVVKQIAYKNLKDKPDVEVIKGFWKFHYQTNDDIGFSALNWINKYFSVPKKFSKNTFETKIMPELNSHYEKLMIKEFYKLDVNGEFYVLEDDIGNYNKNIVMGLLSNAGYKTSKWLFLVLLQGLGACFIVFFYFYSKGLKYLIPLAIIIGGAFGNVIDRIIRGHVVDYVMWTFKFIHHPLFNPWPIFNLADVFTILGALVLIAIMLIFPEDNELTDLK